MFSYIYAYLPKSVRIYLNLHTFPYICMHM